ncbi:MAG: hypothetical protein AAF394_06860, partial [Planctomycetota bacterium]
IAFGSSTTNNPPVARLSQLASDMNLKGKAWWPSLFAFCDELVQELGDLWRCRMRSQTSPSLPNRRTRRKALELCVYNLRRVHLAACCPLL